MELIDIYEGITEDDLWNIDYDVNNILANIKIENLQIETTMGFAYLYDKFIGLRSLTYPIALMPESLGFIYNVPIIPTDNQILRIYDNVNEKIVYKKDLSNYWSRFHKIYLEFTNNLEAYEYLNIELYLNTLGFKFHDKTDNPNLYIVSVMSRNFEVGLNANYRLVLMAEQFIN